VAEVEMLPPQAVDMLGVRVGGFQVVDRAWRGRRRDRAYWWLRCDACAEWQMEDGGWIRQAVAGRRTLWCRHCDAGKPGA